LFNKVVHVHSDTGSETAMLAITRRERDGMMLKILLPVTGP
jgi:hypothetical protein